AANWVHRTYGVSPRCGRGLSSRSVMKRSCVATRKTLRRAGLVQVFCRRYLLGTQGLDGVDGSGAARWDECGDASCYSKGDDGEAHNSCVGAGDLVELRI